MGARFVTVLILLAGVGACSEESAPESTGTAKDAFAEDLGTAVCASFLSCCDQGGYSPPTDDCQSKMRNEVMLAILWQEDEKRELRLEHGDACIETFRELLSSSESCADLTHPRELPLLCPELFGPIPEGEKPPGELCERTHECASPETGDRYCYRRNFNEAAVCTWFVPAAAGEDCRESGGVIPQCPDGLGCAPSVEDPTRLVCGDPADFGEACTVSSGCGAGLTCALGPDAEYICVDTLRPGDPCLQQSDACEPGYFCDLGLGVCDVMPVNTLCNGMPCPAVNLQAVCQ